ncbi:MAG: ThiF family adenylyltransferase [Anderseniella sp.]
MSRYARQMVLPEIGTTGQARLADARVLVVGAGGLGCPVLSYLAGAGVGSIRIVDADMVEVSNLHRQPLYTMADIGQAKAATARRTLAAYNPEIEVLAEVLRLEPANTASLCRDADIVIDAADSFAVTYTLSDHCQTSGQAFVSASVLSFAGYAGGFCGGRAPSVRAVFPDLPQSAANCATAGVSGPAVGILGSLQAQMALSYLLGLEPSPLGRMISLDLRQFTTSSFSFGNAQEPDDGFGFVSVEDISDSDFVVDLRSIDEAPATVTTGACRTTADDIETLADDARNRRAILCCRSGLRAWNAGLRLRQAGCIDISLIALG